MWTWKNTFGDAPTGWPSQWTPKSSENNDIQTVSLLTQRKKYVFPGNSDTHTHDYKEI